MGHNRPHPIPDSPFFDPTTCVQQLSQTTGLRQEQQGCSSSKAGMTVSTSIRTGARSKTLVSSHTSAVYAVDSTIQHSNASRGINLFPLPRSEQQRNNKPPLPSVRQLLSLGHSPINRGVHWSKNVHVSDSLFRGCYVIHQPQ